MERGPWLIREGGGFAAVDNTVTLPGDARIDGAALSKVSQGLASKFNLGNLADRG